MPEQAFKQAIDKALNDPVLRKALGKFGEVFPESRANAYKGIDFEELRKEVKDIKKNAASKYLELAEKFQAEAEKRGSIVHRAANDKEVKSIINEIARKHNVKTIVKSKSMVSEEIHLNDSLIENGFEPAETDLGEWIVWYAGEKPSHMVMPAIHMSKERCAETFSKTLEREIEPDIPLMVKTARETLREKFLIAEMGISGANIAVAETGTLVGFTNEGNLRLTSSLPPVHIFLVGYEKLVENLSDVPTIAKALPRSATAQQLTSYVTMITGPSQTIVNDEVVNKEFHIILVDNGRKKMIEDPVFGECAQCIRCASCLNVCPVYQLVSGHVYGHIYAGGIGTILTAFFNEMKYAKDPQNLCIGCGRCKEVCPGMIDIPKLIMELRKRSVDEYSLPFTAKIILENVLTNRKLFHFMLRQASWAQAPFTAKDKPFIRHLPMFLSELADWRSLPAIAEKPFRDKFKQISQKKAKKGKVAFFAGCLIDFVYPETGESLVKVSNDLGYEVVFPETQSCCGAPAKYMGVPDTAAKMAKQNVDAFANLDVDYILSACPTCTEALVHDWVEQLKDDKVYYEKAKAIAAKVLDFSKFVHTVKGDASAISPEAAATIEKGTKVTYHDSCHMKRNMGIWQEQRELIKEAGLDLVEMKNADKCCGFGGSYCVKMPEISTLLLNEKIDNIEETGAEIIAVDCPGCMMNIKGGLDKRNSKVIVKHTAEILAGK